MAVAFLSGELRQRQIGVGYAALSELLRRPVRASPPPGPARTSRPAALHRAPAPGRPAADPGRVDAVFAAIGAVTGPGTQAERRRLLGGPVRPGHPGRALVPDPAARRRTAPGRAGRRDDRGGGPGGRGEPPTRCAGRIMLGGSLPAVAEAALSPPPGRRPGPRAGPTAAAPRGRGGIGRAARVPPAGGPPAAAHAGRVRAHGGRRLRRGCPRPPWSGRSTASGSRCTGSGAEVRVFTRSLDDITARLPEITGAVLRCPAEALVLDGEAIALGPDGRARPFQVTASRAGTQARPDRRAGYPAHPVLLRPAAPGRAGPGRRARDRAAARCWPRSCPRNCGCRAW